MFEIVTGEGRVLGPYTLKALREVLERMPPDVCFEVRAAGV